MEITHRKYQRVEMTESEFLEKLGMSGNLILLERELPSTCGEIRETYKGKYTSSQKPRMIRMEFEVDA